MIADQLMITDQLTETVESQLKASPAERIKRLQALKEKIDDLEQRGLLNRQTYSAPTRADFYNKYLRR